MLQQTQVAVVLRYWAPFLARFPTLRRLAAAPLESVLGAWSGLGYYARARNLHRAAQAVVEQHAGALPASTFALASLPGFGRYTVGAVASIAFGLAEPVVDGNVARVLCRLFAVHGAPGTRQREERLWEVARRLVPRARPGDWNQALMELGATVCSVSGPSCLLCPVRQHCQALRQGEVAQLPPPRPAPLRRRLHLAVAVARKGSRLLWGRRPAKGLFGGLWELPAVEVTAAATEDEARVALATLLGPKTRVGQGLGTVHRTLTHRALALSLFTVTPPARPRRGDYVELRWASAAEAEDFGVSAAMQAALAQADPGSGGAISAPPRKGNRQGRTGHAARPAPGPRGRLETTPPPSLNRGHVPLRKQQVPASHRGGGPPRAP